MVLHKSGAALEITTSYSQLFTTTTLATYFSSFVGCHMKELLSLEPLQSKQRNLKNEINISLFLIYKLKL